MEVKSLVEFAIMAAKLLVEFAIMVIKLLVWSFVGFHSWRSLIRLRRRRYRRFVSTFEGRLLFCGLH